MSDNKFKCPECGNDEFTFFKNISCIPTPNNPWSSVLSTKTCASCGREIPDHLGERWDDISDETAVKEWKETYRDS